MTDPPHAAGSPRRADRGPALDHRPGHDPNPRGIDGRVESPPPGRRLLAGTFVLLMALVLLAAAGVGWALVRYRGVTAVEVAGVTPSTGSASNWLLVGTDDRAGIDPSDPAAGLFLGEPVEGRRSDTIVLARLDPSAGTIDLLSIPRDLWVPIAGTGAPGRINGASNADDGRARLVATIETTLGVPIHHYVEVDFVGFRQVVDALGGVPVWFSHPARDAGSGLIVEQPGCHLLAGDQALALARSRKLEWLVDGGWRADPTGDVGRTARQRHLLSRLADRAADRLGPTSPLLVDRVASVAAGSVVLDRRTGLGDLVGAVRLVRSGGGEAIVGHALPVTDHVTAIGAQVLLLDEAAAGPVLAPFQGRAGSSPLDAATDGGGVPDPDAITAQDAPADGAAPAEGATAPGSLPASATTGSSASDPATPGLGTPPGRSCP